MNVPIKRRYFLRWPRTIRFQLLLAVNTAMALLLLLFLILDYHREITDRVAEKHVALEEEAKTLLPAVLRIRPYGIQAVQKYVDQVCGRMRDAHSPGHHIAVDLDGCVLQTLAHHRSSPEMLEAMQAAARSPTHQATLGNEELVVGVDHEENLTVFVSEELTNVRQAVRKQIVPRLAGIAVMGIVAAVVVNLVFLRMVAKPLQELVATVRQITKGRFGVQAGPFHNEEFMYLADAINSMSSTLAETERRRRSEMAKARRIQEHLLPNGVEVPGLSLAHHYQPATEVAGDYYDVVALPDGTWLLCIADVTGHGVPAAMSATMLKTLLLHAAEHHHDPDQILRRIHDEFSAVSLTEDFASMMVARWDRAAGTLQYASAGHEPAWFLPATGSLRELRSTGGLLTVHGEGIWETETLQVSPGDRLMMMTDGITEAANPKDELFGRQRLAHLLASCRDVSVSDTLRRIDEAIRAHRGSAAPNDDATAVVMEFTVPAPMPHERPDKRPP